jgi:hypothetical protein
MVYKEKRENFKKGRGVWKRGKVLCKKKGRGVWKQRVRECSIKRGREFVKKGRGVCKKGEGSMREKGECAKKWEESV